MTVSKFFNAVLHILTGGNGGNSRIGELQAFTISKLQTVTLTQLFGIAVEECHLDFQLSLVIEGKLLGKTTGNIFLVKDDSINKQGLAEIAELLPFKLTDILCRKGTTNIQFCSFHRFKIFGPVITTAVIKCNKGMLSVSCGFLEDAGSSNMQREIVSNFSGLLTSHNLIELILGFRRIIGNNRNSMRQSHEVTFNTILMEI